MEKTDLERSLRFAEANGFLGARAEIWRLQELVEEAHRGSACECDACRAVRERKS